MPLSWGALAAAIERDDAEELGRRTPEVYVQYITATPLSRLEILTMLAGRDFVLTPNSFPYDVEAVHEVLWCRRPVSLAVATAVVRDLLPEEEFLIYQNPPHNRSVFHTTHFHVFFRK